jgi:K+ transporter
MAPQAVAGCPSAASEHHPSNRRALLLAALGVVYGDIGTSPL